MAPTVSSTSLAFPFLLSSQPLSLAHGQAMEAVVWEESLGLCRLGSSAQGHGPAIPSPNMHWNFPLDLHLHSL